MSTHHLSTQNASDHIAEQIQQLRQSTRGLKILDLIRHAMDRGELDGLDCRNKDAFVNLLHAYWAFPETTRDLIRYATTERDCDGN